MAWLHSQSKGYGLKCNYINYLKTGFAVQNTVVTIPNSVIMSYRNGHDLYVDEFFMVT